MENLSLDCQCCTFFTEIFQVSDSIPMCSDLKLFIVVMVIAKLALVYYKNKTSQVFLNNAEGWRGYSSLWCVHAFSFTSLPLPLGWQVWRHFDLTSAVNHNTVSTNVIRKWLLSDYERSGSAFSPLTWEKKVGKYKISILLCEGFVSWN